MFRVQLVVVGIESMNGLACSVTEGACFRVVEGIVAIIPHIPRHLPHLRDESGTPGNGSCPQAHQRGVLRLCLYPPWGDESTKEGMPPDYVLGARVGRHRPVCHARSLEMMERRITRLVVGILIWLAYSGINGGFVFPSAAQVKDSKACPTQHTDYETMLSKVRGWFANVLKKNLSSRVMKKMIFGTHAFRRTFFLFAYWGYRLALGSKTLPDIEQAKTLPDIEQAHLSRGARHDSTQSSVTYINDAGTLFEHHKRSPAGKSGKDKENKVSLWSPIHMDQLDSFETLTGGRQKAKSMHELATDYVFGYLKVANKEALSRLSVWQVFEMSMEVLETKESLDADLDKLLEGLDASKAAQIRELVQKRDEQNVAHALDEAVLAQAPPQGPVVVGGPAKKRKQSGMVGDDALVDDGSAKKRPAKEPVEWLSDDVPDLIKNEKNAKRKVELIVEAVNCVKDQQSQGKMLVGQVKSFAYRIGRVASCVRICHGGDVDQFLAANPGMTLSKFSCCAGSVKHTLTK